MSSYEKWLEHQYCAIANAKPVTSAIGHTWRTPRRPSTSSSNRIGTNQASTGVCRPTTAAISVAGIPVRFPAVVIGIAMAPNATGAVFATSTVTAARIGGMPIAMSIAPVIATGAPKPASASSIPPKQKAMSIAWMRMSP